MKQPQNSLHLPKPTRNTHKIANKLMTVVSSEINLQSKHDLTQCHVVKVKATTSLQSMADIIPFFAYKSSSVSMKRDEIKIERRT